MKKLVAHNKWKFMVGYQYLGALGIGLVGSERVQNKILPNVPLYIIYPMAVLGVWAVGSIAIKTGVHSEELKYASEKNTFFTEWRKQGK